MNGGRNESLQSDERTEIFEYSLDKFLKLADNISKEKLDKGEYKELGDNHIKEVSEYLYSIGVLNETELNSMYDGSLDFDECVFFLLEKLIFGLYFTELEPIIVYNASVSGNYVYACNSYVRLAKDLGKTIRSHPFLKAEMLQIENKTIDYELENFTEEIIDIFIHGTHLTKTESSTQIDDFLNYLFRKRVLTQNEFVSAISSNNIEESVEHIISEKLITSGKIISKGVINHFKDFSHALISRKQNETKNKVDGVLGFDDGEVDYEFEYDVLISHLFKGVRILENLGISGGELIDYDVEELIELASEYDVLNLDQAQKFLDLLLKDKKFSAQIIFQVYQNFYESSYVTDIDISDKERSILQQDIRDSLYSLNMLASTGEFR
ncbi:hypothetical protein GW846_01490 [Candidatus Gracilibacteria bacterium]|nr:hypothetical protein [Candidatus Gracilibacteria bacterium]